MRDDGGEIEENQEVKIEVDVRNERGDSCRLITA